VNRLDDNNYKQSVLLQPDNNPTLYRYSAEWKLLSLLKQGLCFSNIAEQGDTQEGIINTDVPNGYSIYINDQHRLHCLASCWTLDTESNPLERLNEYCCFLNENKTENCYGYRVETTYDLLVAHGKSCSRNLNGILHCLQNHELLYGLVQYPNDESYNTYKNEAEFGISNYFMKSEGFRYEKEFRLLLYLSSNSSTFTGEGYEIERPIATKTCFLSTWGASPYIQRISKFDKDGHVETFDFSNIADINYSDYAKLISLFQ